MKAFNVFLLYGWGFDKKIWQPVAKAIQDHRHVKTVNSLKIIDWEKIDLPNEENEDTIIIGWSLGGNLAVDEARKNKSVKAILLINYNPCFCKRGDWSNAMDTEKLKQMQQELIGNRQATLKQFYHWCSTGNYQSINWFKKESKNYSIEQNTEHLLNGLQRLIEDDQRKLLGQLTCSIEMVFSDKDVLVAKELHRECPDLNALIKSNLLTESSHLSPLIEVSKIKSVFDSLLRKIA